MVTFIVGGPWVEIGPCNSSNNPSSSIQADSIGRYLEGWIEIELLF